MTHNAHKAAARRYQAAHPGTPLPEALRATAQPAAPSKSRENFFDVAQREQQWSSHPAAALDPLRGTPDSGPSVTRQVLQACLAVDLSASDLKALKALDAFAWQGRRDRPATVLADQLAQAAANGWRVINCSSAPTTHALDVESVSPQEFPHFARHLYRSREAELRRHNVHHFNQLPSDSPMRKILLFIDPGDIDVIDAAVLQLLPKNRRLGIEVSIAVLSTPPATRAHAESTRTVNGCLSGDLGAGKALRYRKALYAYFNAGCEITRCDDIGFTVAAPEGMTDEEFHELSRRAWS